MNNYSLESIYEYKNTLRKENIKDTIKVLEELQYIATVLNMNKSPVEKINHIYTSLNLSKDINLRPLVENKDTIIIEILKSLHYKISNIILSLNTKDNKTFIRRVFDCNATLYKKHAQDSGVMLLLPFLIDIDIIAYHQYFYEKKLHLEHDITILDLSKNVKDFYFPKLLFNASKDKSNFLSVNDSFALKLKRFKINTILKGVIDHNFAIDKKVIETFSSSFPMKVISHNSEYSIVTEDFLTSMFFTKNTLDHFKDTIKIYLKPSFKHIPYDIMLNIVNSYSPCYKTIYVSRGSLTVRSSYKVSRISKNFGSLYSYYEKGQKCTIQSIGIK